MPTFYPQAMNGHHPLTPPYTMPYDNQPCMPMQYRHDSFVPSQAMAPRLDSTMDYSHRFPPPSAHQPAFARQSWVGPQNLPPISSYYEPLGAPILPPLRIQDAWSDGEYYHRYGSQSLNPAGHNTQQANAAPKEEQTTGGVSAKLDYEMERMTDFVSEAAQGIIQPGTTVHPSFRKWVSQVLSATRLPSATILLSLHYLTVRMRDFPGSIEKSDNQLYRLLTVSMILGSKFLDDNTFINRSWSDVSGIKVSELNALETKWLAMIQYDLHADPEDPNGVALWIRAWKDFEAKAISASKAKSLKLSPLDTNVQRNKSPPSNRHSYQHTFGTFTPLSSGSVSSKAGTPYISSDPWNRQDQNRSSMFNPQAQYQSMDDYDYSGGRYNNHAQNRASQYNQYSLPPINSLAFYSPWNQNSWEQPHGYGCHCVSCSRHNSYIMGNHFPHQAVVG